MQPLRFGISLVFSVLFGIQAFAQEAGPSSAQSEATAASKLPPQQVKIVFFVPSDLAVPVGAQQRLTKIADAAERFLFNEMDRLGYPPAARNLFRRQPDGQVEVMNVRGDKPVASGTYAKSDYADDVIKRATRQYHVSGAGNVWWIFIYLGDRPVRFQDWAGSGNPRDGGWAMVNYDTVPGEIRPDLQLTEGFNLVCFLKSTIHELGHAFGLHHGGPDLTLRIGNSLMGPNPTAYAARKYPNGDGVYLSASSAAMLWKHPIFSGIAMDPFHPSSVQLIDYKPVFNGTADSVTISGKLISDQPLHSAVLIDDRGQNDQYWVQSYAARIAPDGTFQITINQPAKADGNYRILFCFQNGLVTGDGAHVRYENRGEIRKAYFFRDGEFRFARECHAGNFGATTCSLF